MNEVQFIRDVANDCIRYAKKHNCSLRDAAHDWEGDSPSGGFGLSVCELAKVIQLMTDYGMDIDRIPSTR